jgi:hypothetical protein
LGIEDAERATQAEVSRRLTRRNRLAASEKTARQIPGAGRRFGPGAPKSLRRRRARRRVARSPMSLPPPSWRFPQVAREALVASHPATEGRAARRVGQAQDLVTIRQNVAC